MEAHNLTFKIAIVKGFAHFRPAGYVEDLVSRGTINGDWIELRRKYSTPAKPALRGLGDVVAAVAQPIARMIDGRLGTDLENCPGCKADQETLNKLLPFPPARG